MGVTGDEKDVMTMFRPEKSAQAAAVLLTLAPDHTLSRIKLMKLLYLADRASFAEFGATISGDRLVSLPQGPVLSGTLDALQGAPAYRVAFEAWVQPLPGYDHRLVDGMGIADADLLSNADIEVLANTWARFGSMGQWDLVAWTHEASNCPEWTDPNGSAITITLEELAAAVGIDEDEARVLSHQAREAERILDALASL